ncbi:hypothetical protein LMG27177_07641 [Paraburkholderia fynbosensis]|uniref:Uncharacterized protein n=1 Tax=Paraburkholderia fynbosensis TaxID=1200993 RepID=A0A6J5H5Y3_9BURK|nr:hypothetical protein LMG27177_07641 [Paraburkholderia fynbosensis]
MLVRWKAQNPIAPSLEIFQVERSWPQKLNQLGKWFQFWTISK